MLYRVTVVRFASYAGWGGEGGIRLEKLGGSVVPVPKTLTLIYNQTLLFSLPYDQTKNSISYLWPLRLAQLL